MALETWVGYSSWDELRIVEYAVEIGHSAQLSRIFTGGERSRKMVRKVRGWRRQHTYRMAWVAMVAHVSQMCCVRADCNDGGAADVEGWSMKN
jgi:hypothetical protein